MSATAMTTTKKDIIQAILDDANKIQEERREVGRIPFFMPAVMQLAGSDKRFSIFTREISLTGIGLLHWMPVPVETVDLVFTLADEQFVSIKTEIQWCVEAGGGCYISGGVIKNADFLRDQLS